MTDEMKFKWFEVKPSDVEGLGWANQTLAPFDRLPPEAQSLPGVWSCSHSSTGVCVFFNTDSSTVRVRYTLGAPEIGEQNFNVTAHCGVDLYVFDETRGSWRWAAATPHFVIKDQNPDYILTAGMPSRQRKCRMYFPFRNQVLKMEIGVDKSSKFKLVPPRKTLPLVYYGTSIIHGAFSIRSGLGIAQILGRRLNMPLINLGFSGAARLEPEMASLLAQKNAAAFVIDPYHNLNRDVLRQNGSEFFRILCPAHPNTPVILLGAPQHLHGWLHPDIQESQDALTKEMHSLARRTKKLYPNFTYIDGKNFYGSDEVSMDGIHPNDQAFAHMADYLEPRLRKILIPNVH